jgi:hypothetical protein
MSNVDAVYPATQAGRSSALDFVPSFHTQKIAHAGKENPAY